MELHSTHPAIRTSKHRGNTFVLFIVIALFVVGVAMFLNATTKDPTGPVEECPWVEIDRIADDLSMINLPQSPQISLETPIEFTLTITSEDGEKRGRLTFEIDTTGAVSAIWKANYTEGIYKKEFAATCLGNVDADRIFEDGNGIDESKLFFLTRGTFILQAFKQGNAAVGGGEAYVVGWLSPDGSGHGTLVLAPDKKNTKIYTWEKEK